MIGRWLRRYGTTAVMLATLIAMGACGDRVGSDDAATTGGEPRSSPDTVEGPSSSNSPAAAAIELSHERWYARPNNSGDIGFRFFAFVVNTSEAVVEVSIEAEAVDADGEPVGRSGPQALMEFILPGERLPVGLAGRSREEPADVLPVVVTRDVADFKQERYGHIRLTGEVHDVDVLGDEILVEVEIENTGDRSAQSLFYLAAFDSDDTIVAAGPGGWIPSAIDAGETLILEGSLSRDPLVDIDVSRVEVFFPAVASMDAG